MFYIKTYLKLASEKKKIKTKSNLASSEISPLGMKPVAKYYNKKEQKEQPDNRQADKREKINDTTQWTFLHKKALSQKV